MPLQIGSQWGLQIEHHKRINSSTDEQTWTAHNSPSNWSPAIGCIHLWCLVSVCGNWFALSDQRKCQLEVGKKDYQFPGQYDLFCPQQYHKADQSWNWSITTVAPSLLGVSFVHSGDKSDFWMVFVRPSFVSTAIHTINIVRWNGSQWNCSLSLSPLYTSTGKEREKREQDEMNERTFRIIIWNASIIKIHQVPLYCYLRSFFLT